MLVTPTIKPPTGAAPLKVIVPVALTPPVTVLGAIANEARVGGFTVNVPVADTAPVFAVIVTGFCAATATVLAANPTESDPAGTVTEAGTATVVALLDR